MYSMEVPRKVFLASMLASQSCLEKKPARATLEEQPQLQLSDLYHHAKKMADQKEVLAIVSMATLGSKAMRVANPVSANH